MPRVFRGLCSPTRKSRRQGMGLWGAVFDQESHRPYSLQAAWFGQSLSRGRFMIAQLWPFERTAGSESGEVRRLMRAVFCPSHAELVKRFRNANRRTPVQLFLTVALAVFLFQISTVPPFILSIWFSAASGAPCRWHLNSAAPWKYWPAFSR